MNANEFESAGSAVFAVQAVADGLQDAIRRENLEIDSNPQCATGAPLHMKSDDKNGAAPRILIVDDHFVVRQGLRLILRERYPEAFFGEASNAQEALEMGWKYEWDVILLDISMPGRGGLEVLKEFRSARPKTPVIILSMHSEDQFAIRVLRLGASSYVRKDSAGHHLFHALEAALQGSKYITPALAEKLADHVEMRVEHASHETLSDREYQVMCLLAGGMTVKEVGLELNLSVKTISTYRTRILEKMKLKNNADIMRYALRMGLVDV